jgi:pilus assembly protein CpaC
MNRLAPGLVFVLWTVAATADNITTREGAEAMQGRLQVTVGKSLILESPLKIERISVANGELVEAVAISPREVLINGKGPGETTMIVWQDSGKRLVYDLVVRQSVARLEAVRQQIAQEAPGQDVTVAYENDTAFVRGAVKDLLTADRVMSIAATLGKSVNLLQVHVPPPEIQVLLRVRFANLDRSAGSELSAGLIRGTDPTKADAANPDRNQLNLSLGEALNVFLFRKDLNLTATLKLLQSRNLLEILAEPNVLAINGKQASFVAGGEFPFPMVQTGAGGLNQVTLSFREFGVKLVFLPTITPRGTIRLSVAPEVSSLDYANAVTFQGFTVPALNTRKISTEVELDSGQSFVIAGLIDTRTTENLKRVPGIADIPLLGKLFQSRTRSRTSSELLVIVTPEIVRPMPREQAVPALEFPTPLTLGRAPRTPGLDKTGPVPVKPPQETVPFELLMPPKSAPAPAAPALVPTGGQK